MSVCPGCGLELPAQDGPGSRSVGASAACLAVESEVAVFEAMHPTLLAGHQLLVDAYGAQHPLAPRAIRVAYSLVGLHLALDLGWNGLDVRRLHGRMGKPQPDWPAFDRPEALGRRTILDVAEAGARASSLEGHWEALHAWAAEVWSAWSGDHPAVEQLATRFMND